VFAEHRRFPNEKPPMSSSFSDQPSPHDPERDEGYTARPRPTRPPEPPDDEYEEAPRLGSLAQKARGKELNQARGILLVIGMLTLLCNAADLVTFQRNIAQAGGRIPPGIVALVYGFDGAFILMGLLFVIFGIIIHRFPVPVTIISLVLYILGTVVTLGILAVSNQGMQAGMTVGLVVRVLIIIALVKAVQAALAYERERRDGADLP
jgi:hypothetical protein